MAQHQIVAQEDARIGFQANKSGGGILRSRIPTGIIEALSAQDGDYFRWTVLSNGRVIGQLIDEADARPRNAIAERQAALASKTKAKKITKKGGATKKPARGDSSLDSAFAEEEDDGSEPEVARKAMAPRKPVTLPRKPVAALPVPARKQAPARSRAPIPKPSQVRRVAPQRRAVRHGDED